MLLYIAIYTSYVGGFSIIPSPVVQVEDQRAKFYCQYHPTTVSIGWKLNDVPFLQNPLPNVTHTIETLEIGNMNVSVHVLTMLAHMQYNGTKVECLAALGNSIVIAEPPATLSVQG